MDYGNGMNGAGPFNSHYIRLYSYRIPLIKPVVIQGKKLDHSEGFLLRISSDTVDRWGDIAPLPGYSTENSDDVRRDLTAMKNSISDLKKLAMKYPSVQWGYDCATGVPTISDKSSSVPIARQNTA